MATLFIRSPPPHPIRARDSYASLPQKDSEGMRSNEDEACFQCGLKHMDCIFAHQGTVTFLSTKIPLGVTGIRPYHLRGWVRALYLHHLERCALRPVAFAPHPIGSLSG